MKKRIVTSILILAFAAAVLSGCGTTKSADPGEYLPTPSNVTVDMLQADYWLKDSQSEIVRMSPDEIKAFNSKNRPGSETGSGDIVALSGTGETIDGNTVTVMLQSFAIPDDPEIYELNGTPTTKKYWEKLYQLQDIESIPETVDVQFGYSTAWTTLRTFPTRDRVVINGDLMFDEILISDSRPYEPLAVIHESADGKWYYCIMENCSGWIEKEYVALCESREDWIERQNPDEFLVVTGDMITLAQNPYDEAVSELSLPMGTRLELVRPEDAPAQIDGRIGYGCYIVKIPVTGEDGTLEDRYTYVASSDDVNIGYLAFTSGAVLRQAFKYLGNVYGWGGDLHSADCSGMVKNVFSCFGFNFLRTTSLQMTMTGFTYENLSGVSDEKKAEILKELPAGSLLYFKGHAMIWLGEENENYYVISSVSTFGQDVHGVDSVNTVTINALNSSYRADGSTWLRNISFVLSL